MPPGKHQVTFKACRRVQPQASQKQSTYCLLYIEASLLPQQLRSPRQEDHEFQASFSTLVRLSQKYDKRSQVYSSLVDVEAWVQSPVLRGKKQFKKQKQYKKCKASLSKQPSNQTANWTLHSHQCPLPLFPTPGEAEKWVGQKQKGGCQRYQ